MKNLSKIKFIVALIALTSFTISCDNDDKDGNVIYSEDNTQLNWKWIAPYTTGELEYEYCKNIVN